MPLYLFFKRVAETLRSLRRGMGLKICPRCGGQSLKPISSISGWLTPITYICGECGYKGSLILEVECIEDKDLVKEA